MCNLYSITTNQAAIIALFRVMNRYVGNLPPMPGVFPDYRAPVVRTAGAERALTMMRWGMPRRPHWVFRAPLIFVGRLVARLLPLVTQWCDIEIEFVGMILNL
jgi:putative SOS response-associated peptidase YedK